MASSPVSSLTISPHIPRSLSRDSASSALSPAARAKGRTSLKSAMIATVLSARSIRQRGKSPHPAQAAAASSTPQKKHDERRRNILNLSLPKSFFCSFTRRPFVRHISAQHPLRLLQMNFCTEEVKDLPAQGLRVGAFMDGGHQGAPLPDVPDVFHSLPGGQFDPQMKVLMQTGETVGEKECIIQSMRRSSWKQESERSIGP